MSKKQFKSAYTGSRQDVLALIPEEAKRILNVGCANGAMGEEIKSFRNNITVFGIEKNKQMGLKAKKKLDRVIIGDIEEMDFSKKLDVNSPFDCIVFADILEHLRDPWAVMQEFRNFLTKEGKIVASIPNVRHFSTLFALAVKGKWPYRERGIHDSTHLRFFTMKNIREMFKLADLKIVDIKRKYRIIEKPHKYNRFSGILALFLPRELLTFQYLIKAVKN